MRPGTPGFIGARLREAREARGLTAASLADLVDVTRAAISQYEGGHQSPSPVVLRRISERLNVPIQRFIKPVPNRESGIRHYRCMATATKRARVRAERRYGWIREICDYLAQYVKFPTVRFPDLGLPTDPARISFEQAEEAAGRTRDYFGIPDGPVENVVWTLENHGAIVARYDLEAATLDAFSEWCPVSERPFVILSTEKCSKARSRFDAAHELAHMVLHQNTPKALVCQRDSFDLMERQAHRFAGAFLLPERSFVNELYAPTLDAFRSLKERWHVAISAMIMRAADLKMVSDSQQKNLWINLGRRRWRTREPLDDKFEPETPRYLARCVQALIERRTISPFELAFQMGLPAEDIERLLCLSAGVLGQYPADDRSLGTKDCDESPAVIQFPRFAETKCPGTEQPPTVDAGANTLSNPA